MCIRDRVQIVATAYARGVDAWYPASRYMDTLAFGAMANAIAAAWLLSLHWSAAGPRQSGFVPGVTAAAWIVTLGFGLHGLSKDVLGVELPDARKYYTLAESNLRRYLGTNDPRELSYPEIPFPSAAGLIDRLANPHLRALMPLPVRAPLAIRPAPPSTGFVENDARGSFLENPPALGISPATLHLDAARSWGSFTPESGAAATGEWRSLPLQPNGRGWLKFDVAGQPGGANSAVTLELRDAASDALLGVIQPSKVPGDNWRAGYIPAPTRPYVIVARDNSRTAWLAFSGPTEMGPLSYWAWRATKHGLLIVYITGAVCLALVVVVALRINLRPALLGNAAARRTGSD